MDCREPTRIKEQTIKKIMLIALICLCRYEGRHTRADLLGVDAAQIPERGTHPRFHEHGMLVANINTYNIDLSKEEFSALEACLNQCRVCGHRGLDGF